MSNTLKRRTGKLSHAGYGIVTEEMRPDIPAFINPPKPEPGVIKRASVRQRNRDAEPGKKGLFDGRAVDRIQLTRFTYDTWMRCYPDSNKDGYLKYHKPHDFLGYVGEMLTQAMGQNYPDGGMLVSAALVDDGYFAWLETKGSSDSSAMRSAYCRECGPDAEGRCAEAGLAVTEHLYGIPVNTAATGTVSTVFDDKAADGLAQYMQALIAGENFTACCLPLLVPPERFVGCADDLESLARGKFAGEPRDAGAYADYAECDTGIQGDPQPALFFIPLLIREMHPHACVTAWDAFSAMDAAIVMDGCLDGAYTPEFLGRHPEMVTWDAEMFAKAGRTDVPPFMQSEACKALRMALGAKLKGMPFLIQGAPVPPGLVMKRYGVALAEAGKGAQHGTE